jgi:hypothetical protein
MLPASGRLIDTSYASVLASPSPAAVSTSLTCVAWKPSQNSCSHCVTSSCLWPAVPPVALWSADPTVGLGTGIRKRTTTYYTWLSAQLPVDGPCYHTAARTPPFSDTCSEFLRFFCVSVIVSFTSQLPSLALQPSPALTGSHIWRGKEWACRVGMNSTSCDVSGFRLLDVC